MYLLMNFKKLNKLLFSFMKTKLSHTSVNVEVKQLFLLFLILWMSFLLGPSMLSVRNIELLNDKLLLIDFHQVKDLPEELLMKVFLHWILLHCDLIQELLKLVQVHYHGDFAFLTRPSLVEFYIILLQVLHLALSYF